MRLKKIFRPRTYALVILSTFSMLEGLTTVNNATELNSAIINANSGGETLIQFGSSFTYSQVFRPLNANNVLIPVNKTFTIDGQGQTLTRTGAPFPGFFAREGTGTITIKDLTIIGGHMQGGNGGVNRAGGGLGAGGGIFLNSGSSVVLENVQFQNCSATGGNGATFADLVSGGGGGGGIGGNGGNNSSRQGGGGGGGFSGGGGGGGGGGGSSGVGGHPGGSLILGGNGGGGNSYGNGGGGGGGGYSGAAGRAGGGGGQVMDLTVLRELFIWRGVVVASVAPEE